MTFAEAMRRYGSDKPDLRNPMELKDIADLVKDVEFSVFAQAANERKISCYRICVCQVVRHINS
ncbi:hypothetical protein ACLK1W_09975 [Escherichia coli]